MRGWRSSLRFSVHTPPCAEPRRAPPRPRGFPRIRARQMCPVRTRLERADARSVDMSRIFDASLFRPHRRDVGAERGQDLVSAAGLSGYDGDYADHCSSRLRLPSGLLNLTSADLRSPAKRHARRTGSVAGARRSKGSLHNLSRILGRMSGLAAVRRRGAGSIFPN